MQLLDAPAQAEHSSNGFLERIRAADNARVTREVEARRIRVAQEASGQWAKQTDEYPELTVRADTPDRAKRLLVDAIWFQESGWSDHVDDETADYLNLTVD